MRLSHHLRRRSGVFYFRIAVPDDLRPFAGRAEITRSLHTRDIRKAQLMAYTLSFAVLDAFDKARTAMIPPNPKDFDPFDRSTWPTAEGNNQQMVVRLPGGIEMAADPNIPADLAALDRNIQLLHPMIADHLKRMAEIAAAAPAPAPAPVPMAMPVDPAVKPCRLSQAVEEYLANFTAESPKTKPKYELALHHFQNWLKEGSTFTEKDPFVHEITAEHVSKWKEALRADAVVRAEKKRQRPTEQARIAADPQLARLPLDLKLRTAENYLTALASFLKEMQSRGHFSRQMVLPTTGQNFLSKKERQRHTWLSFTEDEVKVMFAPGNYQTLEKPHEYWFPLLALLTGARREEMAQLALDNIRKERGVWIIDINDEDYRRVKNESSIRKIPLHPVLIDLGFLDYLDAVRKAGATRIFPYLRYDEQNGFGDVPGEAFNRYMTKLGIKQDGKVMHSFRKYANGRLEENDVDEPLRCRMVGHAYDTINFTIYTKGKVSVEKLVSKVLPFFTFPEIDFAALRRPEGFAAPLTKEIAAAKRRMAQAKRRAEREQAEEA